MSVLSKKEILNRVKSGELVFEPALDNFQVRTHSIDLRLGFTFMLPKSWELTKNGRTSLNIDYLNRADKRYFETINLKPGQYFEILPREFVVVETLEKVKIPEDIMAILYPRSSINRRGLSIDLSGIIDAGYEGNLIIPLKNNTSSQIIRVYPGERFCQLVFHALISKVDVSLSRYAKKNMALGSLREQSEDELTLIASGKIDELKKTFSINPIERLAYKAEIFGKKLPKSKRGVTDRQITDATAKIVARKIIMK